MLATIEVVAAAIIEDGKVLIARRAHHTKGAGQWEFPGGKVERGESQSQALIREIKEELGFDIRVREKVGDHVHDYGEKVIHLHLYLAQITGGEQVLQDHDQTKWVLFSEIPITELAPADRPLVEVLIACQSRK
ncbi:MAG: (deoxy)nucleoside triphosphate pyrophosphohydrolase [Bdellovibrionia bacterium]